VDEAVREYIDAIPTEHRAMFDRLHRLILEAHPDATSSRSPAADAPRWLMWRAVLARKHGLSVYGWQADHDAGFSARHPEFLASKATIRLRPQDAAGLGDDELRDFLRATLNTGD
jgi:hypothetical protein